MRSNRLQFLIMYTDTLSKQCDEKLKKSNGPMSHKNSFYLYYDPRKSKKKSEMIIQKIGNIVFIVRLPIKFQKNILDLPFGFCALLITLK